MNEDNQLISAQETIAGEKAACAVPHRSARYGGLSAGVRMALALALCVTAVFCKLGAPERAEEFSRLIVGDGSERVQKAFFSMEEALETEELPEALNVFCRTLTDETD